MTSRLTQRVIDMARRERDDGYVVDTVLLEVADERDELLAALKALYEGCSKRPNVAAHQQAAAAIDKAEKLT